MGDLESQEEDSPKRVLWYKPMAWLGVIKAHRRDEAWSPSLWQTFFALYVGAQIPAIAELPPLACGCNKFALDALGHHVSTCTTHSGAKKAHDCAFEQLADLFRTTHRVKTQQVARSWGQGCGDIELSAHLADVAGPLQLVLDLRIARERWGSSSNPSLNRQLHYPADLDRPLNEAADTTPC
jgi:hypothetical protein